MAIPRSYHCICSTFILATNHDLATLPRRGDPALDKAIILHIQNQNSPDKPHTTLQSLVADRQPTMVRRDDGFEKRTLLKCQRCNSVIGYRLDQTQFKNEDIQAQDIVYILPGALSTTEDMMNEKIPAQPEWAQQKV